MITGLLLCHCQDYKVAIFWENFFRYGGHFWTPSVGTLLMRSNFKLTHCTISLVENRIPALKHHRTSGAGTKGVQSCNILEIYIFFVTGPFLDPFCGDITDAVEF